MALEKTKKKQILSTLLQKAMVAQAFQVRSEDGAVSVVFVPYIYEQLGELGAQEIRKEIRTYLLRHPEVVIGPESDEAASRIAAAALLALARADKIKLRNEGF